ncbi:MAG TPA: PilZ domain-containing protein [Microvirga sp.]|jgi:hypothetical protein|nr:PilZ domain-containing protein [Microvirga sp.]
MPNRSDTRRQPRHPTYLEGHIGFDTRKLTLKCLVRNLSGLGASLVLPGEYALPREFDVHIASRGQSYRAHLVWSRGNRCGVAFTDADLRREPESRRGPLLVAEDHGVPQDAA